MLVFPGIFKGALEGHSTHITSEMKLAAAHAIAGLVPAEELSDTNILPHAFEMCIRDSLYTPTKPNAESQLKMISVTLMSK